MRALQHSLSGIAALSVIAAFFSLAFMQSIPTPELLAQFSSRASSGSNGTGGTGGTTSTQPSGCFCDRAGCHNCPAACFCDRAGCHNCTSSSSSRGVQGTTGGTATIGTTTGGGTTGGIGGTASSQPSGCFCDRAGCHNCPVSCFCDRAGCHNCTSSSSSRAVQGTNGGNATAGTTTGGGTTGGVSTGGGGGNVIFTNQCTGDECLSWGTYNCDLNDVPSAGIDYICAPTNKSPCYTCRKISGPNSSSGRSSSLSRASSASSANCAAILNGADPCVANNGTADCNYGEKFINADLECARDYTMPLCYRCNKVGPELSHSSESPDYCDRMIASQVCATDKVCPSLGTLMVTSLTCVPDATMPFCRRCDPAGTTSSRKSSSSSAKTCDGTACISGGTEVCRGIDASYSCITSDAGPCFRCIIVGAFSSRLSSSSSSDLCAGNECAEFGTEFCEGFETPEKPYSCLKSNTPPCFKCIIKHPQSSRRSSSSAQNLCTGNECAQFGTSFCEGLDPVVPYSCLKSTAAPCFKCIIKYPQSSSRRSSSSNSSVTSAHPACGGTECVSGGTAICDHYSTAEVKYTCGTAVEAPCYRCLKTTITSSSNLSSAGVLAPSNKTSSTSRRSSAYGGGGGGGGIRRSSLSPCDQKKVDTGLFFRGRFGMSRSASSCSP